MHSKSYARLQTKKGAHLPLIIVRKIPDQLTSAVHAWLAVRWPHATTPGDDGLSMASGGTRQVPTTANMDFCNADNSKLRSAMPAFLHAGSKYMSWTILITYQNECAHVYSYRKLLLLLLEFGQFLVDFRGNTKLVA